MIADFQGVVHLDSDITDPRATCQPSNFTNFLNSRFVYNSDDFEVGLHEIQFPYSWHNLPKDQGVAVISNGKCLDTMRRIPAGCYHTLGELLHQINTIFFTADEVRPQAIVSEITGKVTLVIGVYLGIDEAYLWFTQDLAAILGFPQRYVFEGVPADEIRNAKVTRVRNHYPYLSAMDDGYETARNPPALHINVPRLYVTSSIVKHVSHHHTSGLLRAVAAESGYQFAQVIVRYFDRPIFVPLTHGSFDRIDISITDSRGQAIKFLTGNVIVSLEFRRRKYA